MNWILSFAFYPPLDVPIMPEWKKNFSEISQKRSIAGQNCMPSAFILRSINWTYGFNPAGEGGDIKQYPPGQMELF